MERNSSKPAAILDATGLVTWQRPTATTIAARGAAGRGGEDCAGASGNRRFGRLARLLFAACLLFCTAGVAQPYYEVRYIELPMPFLYRRTLYLENLRAPLAWWANPALTADVETPTILTVNSSPVDEMYTISSVRCAFPLIRDVALGVGILGAGPAQTGSFQASQSGAEYSSHFVFERPSLQVAAATPLPYIGSAGAFIMAGVERGDIGGGGLVESYPLLGFSAGWLSPLIAEALQLSATTLFTGRFHTTNSWDKEAKLGMTVTVLDSLFSADLEYAFSLEDGMQLGRSLEPGEYETLRFSVGFRTLQIMRVQAGITTDFSSTDDYSDLSGRMLHGSLEATRSDYYPFFGGYNIGVSLDGQWKVIHRFWAGYEFGKRAPAD